MADTIKESEKGYTRLAFVPDRAIQARELDQMQQNAEDALRDVADVMFVEGARTAGAGCAVDAEGNCTLDEGRLYLAGRVRSVAAAVLQVATVGQVSVGVYLLEQTVTAVHDPDLYDQAIGAPAYGEAGADRIKATVTWGQLDDGQPGDFYPVWTIIDGVVRNNEPAPQLTAITKAIEAYDVQSTGSNYVSEGLITTRLEDDEQGRQVYSVSAGMGRVGGALVREDAARRMVFAAVPDVQAVLSEPHTSATEAKQRIAFERTPVLLPATVRVERRVTVELTHSPLVGSADALPYTSVVKIVSVKQGATTYAQGNDYKLTASQVDWSPPGAEVAPGSKYIVECIYVSTEAVQGQTPYDFEITGAVKDTVMYVDYEFAMRRIDVIVINAEGELNVVKGVPAVWQPVVPTVPSNLLALASVWQTWDALGAVRVDQVRMVPMDVLKGYQDQINLLKTDQAELRLAVDVSGRYSGLKKGYFADPMLDNSMRDQGMEQTALIAGQALQLDEPMEATALDNGSISHAMQFTRAVYLAQTAISQSLTVTPPPPPVPPPPPPPLPASATLTPAVDRWQSDQKNIWYPQSSANFIFLDGVKTFENTLDHYGNKLDASKLKVGDIYLREIEVRFKLEHFKPLELLAQLSFDGQLVTAQPLVGGTLMAGDNGVIEGRFTVPPKLPSGTKVLAFAGSAGSKATARYTGQAEIKVNLSIYAGSPGNALVGSREVTYVI